MRIFRQFDRFLARAETSLLIAVLSGIIILAFGQVILRNLFDGGLLWADTLSRQLVLWVGFLGASLAVRENKHLSIDFLPNLISPEHKRWVKSGTQLAAAVISLFLAQAAMEFLQFEREAESILFGDIPVWWFQTVLPYSLLVITFRFLLNFVETARGDAS